MLTVPGMHKIALNKRLFMSADAREQNSGVKLSGAAVGAFFLALCWRCVLGFRPSCFIGEIFTATRKGLKAIICVKLVRNAIAIRQLLESEMCSEITAPG